ncbi:MAG: FN3 associated domain-containing protein [Sarcina sp.]
MIAITSVFNFIRRTVYPNGRLIQDDIDTVLYEIESAKQRGLKGTYALKYDALMEKKYIEIITKNIDENDEIACWWEVDKSLAEKAGVKWKAKTPIDDTVNIGYSLAYTPDERIKLIDAYMYDFKEIFGYYPKTVGSWVIDIISLKYFKEKYGVTGCVICRDQIGTDGFTLNGGYYNQGYYPSIYNEFIPAQTAENMLKLPIFRMLGPDPIYAFEDGIRKSVIGVYTLEPAATIAQDSEWVNWIFKRLTDEKDIGFSFAQVGQENTFLWNTMNRGFDAQMPVIEKLKDEKKLVVMNICELSEWFNKRYELTPVTSFSASEDWNIEENLKTVWYNSRFYRISFLYEKNNLYIRDLNIFDELYKSRYHDDILIEKESIFDALPIVKPHYWSDENNRNKIDIIESENQNIFELENIKFDSDEVSKYFIEGINKEKNIKIVCSESNIELKANFDFELNINILPVLRKVEENKIICKYNNFNYYIKINNGKINFDNNILRIKSINKKIKIDFSMDKRNKELEFLDNTFKDGKKDIYDYSRLENVSTKVIKKAFKPIINKKSRTVDIGEITKIKMHNPNERGQIYYTLNGDIPSKDSICYSGEFKVKGSFRLKSIVIAPGLKNSEIEELCIFETFKIKDIKARTEPVDRKLYNKNGVKGLLDKELGSIHYNDGNWLGYHDDLDIDIILQEKKYVESLKLRFLQDTRAWIYYPIKVIVQISNNGIDFDFYKEINLSELYLENEIGIKDLEININEKCDAIRLLAKNMKVGPKNSLMPNEGPLFIFVDKVIIK